MFSGRAAACFKAQRVATVQGRRVRVGSGRPSRIAPGRDRGSRPPGRARRRATCPDGAGATRAGRWAGGGGVTGPVRAAVPGWWRRSGRPGQGGVGPSPPPVGKVAIPAASPPRGVRRLPEDRGWRLPDPMAASLETPCPRPADLTRSSPGRTGPSARSRPRGRQRALATRPSGAGAHLRPRASPTALPILSW